MYESCTQGGCKRCSRGLPLQVAKDFALIESLFQLNTYSGLMSASAEPFNNGIIGWFDLCAGLSRPKAARESVISPESRVSDASRGLTEDRLVGRFG